MAYTKAQEARLTEASPITFEQAGELALEFGVSTKSVISKIQNLNLEYIKKAVPAKKAPQTTKAELVASIEKATGFAIPGLIGASRNALVDLNIWVYSGE